MIGSANASSESSLAYGSLFPTLGSDNRQNGKTSTTEADLEVSDSYVASDSDIETLRYSEELNTTQANGVWIDTSHYETQTVQETTSRWVDTSRDVYIDRMSPDGETPQVEIIHITDGYWETNTISKDVQVWVTSGYWSYSSADLSPAQQRAQNAGFGTMPATLAEEWFPSAPKLGDPVMIGNGMYFNPTTGRVLTPNVNANFTPSPVLDRWVKYRFSLGSATAAVIDLSGYLSPENPYTTTAEILAWTKRVLTAVTPPTWPGAKSPTSYAPSNNYDVENARAWGQSPEWRANRMAFVMDSKKNQLLAMGQKYNIDPRAIAAAITWEFSQNFGGYTSDLFTPANLQNGYGWGQIHDTTLTQEMIQSLSKEQSIQLRGSLDSAIELIAARMDQQSRTYQNISGINLRDNIVALTWIYNASATSIIDSASRQGATIANGGAAQVQIINDMAYWVSHNTQLFGSSTPTTPVPHTGSPYTFTVSH
jgi:hypothetical protein